MIDMRTTVIPKSDQLNADDLIGETRTIRVTKVSLLEAADQPIAIGFEGDNGKPYKPCKSMRRVLIMVWGNDGNKFVGRSMTLYRDEKVVFGGAAVGGIRISHMSDIDAPVTMALTATRASRKPYTVKPLVIAAPALPAPTAPEPKTESFGGQATSSEREELIARATKAAAAGMDSLRAFWTALSKADKALAGGAVQLAAWKAIAEIADAPDVGFDDDNNNTSSSRTSDGGTAAAAGASEPVEMGVDQPANEREGRSAPDPRSRAPTAHMDAYQYGTIPASGGKPSDVSRDEAGNGRGAGGAVERPSNAPSARPRGDDGSSSSEGPAPHQGPQTGVEGASASGAASTPATSTKPLSDDARKARAAEIRVEAQARAEAGTAALMNYWEERRQDGEADLLSSTVKAALRDVAKAADAAKGAKR